VIVFFKPRENNQQAHQNRTKNTKNRKTKGNKKK
jgi:hypothetical protein